MGVCRVAFTDSEGIVHTVEVQADSLYEAVEVAVVDFRRDEATSEPSAMTEFTVTAFRKPIEHRIRLGHVTKWALETTKDGSAGIYEEGESEGASRQFSATVSDLHVTVNLVGGPFAF